MKPKFFRTAADFRIWLHRHHGTAAQLLVGFYKRSCGRPGITWPESVDEALCYGWIDGIRKRVDETSYTIRFTPRRAGSIPHPGDAPEACANARGAVGQGAADSAVHSQAS